MSNNPPATDVGRPKTARPQGKAVGAGQDNSEAFDEETYLRFNPDVRAAVAAGAFRSGRDHYERYGRAEGRPYKMLDPRSRNRIIVTGDPRALREAARPPVCAVDQVRLSRSGGIFIFGWVNDTVDALDSVDLYFGSWSVSFDGATLARVRRGDAEAALSPGGQHAYGFWGFIAAGGPLPAGQCSVVVRLKSGGETGFILHADMVEDQDMRNTVLANLTGGAYFGSHRLSAATSVENFIAPQLVEFNKAIGAGATAVPYVERFGGQKRNYRGSIIVCLYGRAEYMFLQSAAFARQPGIQDYEFIYVCNSPEIGEALLREARLCRHIYGLDQTVVILSGNAGFGAANNLGARHAGSDRLLIMNPDVFPHDKDWIVKHSGLIAELPEAQTTLFGAPLYYDDGSLMHGGMYFDIDRVPYFGDDEKASASLLRVEHYGKGAPPDTAAYLQARPVPAVSGAFMSVAKSWFEARGGFTEDYIYGHYEDADFCMKSLAAGCAPWLHDIKLWHLEGKGSDRQAHHEGGSAVNRWLFTRNWARTIEQNRLLGPRPEHPAFAGVPDAKGVPPAPVTMPVAARRP